MFANSYILFLAALVPMLVGSLWYGPLLGKPWMKVNGFTEESLKGGNMAIIFGVSYFLSILLTFGISGLAIHQQGLLQLFATHADFGVAGTEVNNLYTNIMNQFGDRHRSFGHGAVHGVITSIAIALPLIAINALFERRGWKYIGIHFGYWLITIILISAIVCKWL